MLVALSKFRAQRRNELQVKNCNDVLRNEIHLCRIAYQNTLGIL